MPFTIPSHIPQCMTSLRIGQSVLNVTAAQVSTKTLPVDAILNVVQSDVGGRVISPHVDGRQLYEVTFALKPRLPLGWQFGEHVRPSIARALKVSHATGDRSIAIRCDDIPVIGDDIALLTIMGGIRAFAQEIDTQEIPQMPPHIVMAMNRHSYDLLTGDIGGLEKWITLTSPFE